MGTGELLRARRAGLAGGVCLTTGVLEVLLVCPGNPAQLVLGMGTAPQGFFIMSLGSLQWCRLLSWSLGFAPALFAVRRGKGLAVRVL